MSRRSLLLLVLGGLSLLGGLTGALALLGIGMPGGASRLAAAHGMLMVLGFLGTMIALERAAALDRAWAYLAPLAAGLGALGLLLGAPGGLVGGLFLLAGMVFVGMYLVFERIQPVLHIHLQAVAALAWPIAVLLWLSGRPVAGIVPWLVALLVLIIVGERLELSRLGNVPDGTQMMLMGSSAIFVSGVVLTVWMPDAGMRVAGAGLVVLAAWLASHDLARRTVRMNGVTRFIALCLLAGYAWLGVAGLLWLAGGTSAGMALHDARLHAVFLGFVMSMVFGHAPVIIPAVLRVPLPYHRRFYAHLALLHIGLALRIGGGDVLGVRELWQMGGLINVIALLLFVAASSGAVIGELRARRRTAPSRVRSGAIQEQTGKERRQPVVQ